MAGQCVAPNDSDAHFETAGLDMISELSIYYWFSVLSGQ